MPKKKEPTVEDKLSALTDQLAISQAEAQKSETDRRRAQAKADRLEQRARVSTLQRSQQRRTPQRPPAPDTKVENDLADFANEQAKEAMLYKEAMKRGLTQEDLDDNVIEFNTAIELTLLLDNLEQKQRLTQLEQSAKEREEAPPVTPSGNGETPPSVPPIDTGGVSGTEGAAQLQEELDTTYESAEKLGGAGKNQEARWLILKASHKDPRKIVKKAVKV